MSPVFVPLPMSSGADTKRVGWRLRPRTGGRLEGECNESRARSSTSSFTSLASGLSLVTLMLRAAVSGMHDGDSFSDGDAGRSDKTTTEGDEGRDSERSMIAKPSPQSPLAWWTDCC